MPIQDDARENAQIILFGLDRPEGGGRSGVDAILKLGEVEIPFELKTTTSGSVTTVRDFGYDHIAKWKNKHWLITKYSTDGNKMEYSIYGSPQAMALWIGEKEEYIRPDFQLAQLIPDKLTLQHLYQIVGKRNVYSLDDAKKLQKMQYRASEYRDLMDVKGGYSAMRMLMLLKARCRYLIERGSTLNNPHIPPSYFDGWERIETNHALKLRELVVQSLKT